MAGKAIRKLFHRFHNYITIASIIINHLKEYPVNVTPFSSIFMLLIVIEEVVVGRGEAAVLQKNKKILQNIRFFPFQNYSQVGQVWYEYSLTRLVKD